MKKKIYTYLSLVAVLSGIIVSALALPVQGVAASSWDLGDVIIGNNWGSYDVYNNYGRWKENYGSLALNFAIYNSCAFNSSLDKLYFGVARLVADGSHKDYIDIYDNSIPHTLLQYIDVDRSWYGDHVQSIVFAANGDFYVGYAGKGYYYDSKYDVTYHHGAIERYNSAGVLQKEYQVARDLTIDDGGVYGLDLSADQKTLVYTSKNKFPNTGNSYYLIQQFDVSANQQLSNLTGIASGLNGITGTIGTITGTGLKILPPENSNGGILVTHIYNGHPVISRVNGAGDVIQGYYLPNYNANVGVWTTLSLDPNGKSFWAGDGTTGNFYRFNIDSGQIELGPILIHEMPHGSDTIKLQSLCLKGESVAALPANITVTPLSATNNIGTDHTITVTVIKGSVPVPNITVDFIVSGVDNEEVDSSSITNANGQATFTYTNNGTAGKDVIQACFTDSLRNVRQCAKATKDWFNPTTTLTYSGDSRGDFNDPAKLSAKLVDANGDPIPNAIIKFAIGSQTCQSNTAGTGIAICSISPKDAVGETPLIVKYPGDAYQPSKFNDTFFITPEETAITYTGPINIAQSKPVTLSGVLKEDGSSAISGRSVTLSLGSQNCTGTTDDTGKATCTISSISAQLGYNTISASFAGDAYYQPAKDSKYVLIFDFLSGGSFVLGDKTVASALPDTALTWWGKRWSKNDDLSGGSAQSSFQGFANDLSSAVPSCGMTWTIAHRDGSVQPTGVPSYMAVIVSSKIVKFGNTFSGDTSSIVIVKTDSGYMNDPGHAGTGTLVATLCKK